MKTLFLYPGRTKPKDVASAVDIYHRRLQGFGAFEECIVRDEKVDHRAPEVIIAAEGKRLLAALDDRDWVIVCDERGRQRSTRELATLLSTIYSAQGAYSGRKRVVFVMGGALGVADSVRARADDVLALSALTLAGGIARLVLLEAIYRAVTVIHRHPYHND